MRYDSCPLHGCTKFARCNLCNGQMLTDTNLRIPGVWPRFEIPTSGMKPNALPPKFLSGCQEPNINICQVKFHKCCVQYHERWVVGNELRLWHTNVPSQCSAVIAPTFDIKTSLPTQHRLQIDAWLSDPFFMMQNIALSIYHRVLECDKSRSR